MRARTRNLLLLAALLAAAGLGLLLLPDGGRDRTGGPAAGAVPAPLPRGNAAARAAIPGEEGVAGSAVPDGPHLDLRAVVEGDWGLAGLQVLALVRFPDGSLEAWIGDDAPEGGETDVDGRITLRYKTEPPERLFAVGGDDAALLSVENADPAGEVHGLKAFRAASTGPVTLRYRDRDGLVLVRPVDGRTGEALSGRRGVRLVWTWTEVGGDPMPEYDEPLEKAPGWLRISWTAEPDTSDLRLLVPGYLPFPAPAEGWKGRVVVPLEPDPAAVRGRIVAPEGWQVSSALRSAADGRECDAAALCGQPSESGPFVLGGVPEGEWELVVTAEPVRHAGDEASWATRRFRFDGKGVDLGEIRPLPGAVVRVRLLSEEGKPVPSSHIRLEWCDPGEVPILGYSRGPRQRESVGVHWPGRDSRNRAADHEPGEDGWAVFRGLPPGDTFLAATPLVPGLTRTVTAPAGPGEILSVELDGRCRKTPCVLHFTIDGEEAAFWRHFSGPAYSDQFSTGKGVLEADILPGRYRVVAQGSPGPEPEFHAYYGEIEIPEGGRFEATVDLKRKAR